MTTLIAATLTLFFVVLIVGLLEKAHRRQQPFPHAPWGGDTEHDADLQRVLHDLDVSRR